MDEHSTDDPHPNRFPAWVYRQGGEPDPRFSLANERTFLAWIRTSLALLAGGVGLQALHLPDQPVLRLVAAGVLLLLGLLSAVQGWVGWARAERRMRLGQALPGPTSGAVIAGGVVVVAVIVVVGSLL